MFGVTEQSHNLYYQFRPRHPSLTCLIYLTVNLTIQATKFPYPGLAREVSILELPSFLLRGRTIHYSIQLFEFAHSKEN